MDKDGDEIVSSYRLLMVAHNSSGLDSWVVLNSSVKENTRVKTIKTARGLISLMFRCGVKIVNTVSFIIIKQKKQQQLQKFQKSSISHL